MPSPAEKLSGLALARDWTVVKKVDPGYGATGGHFSCTYEVVHENGSTAFLKALDYSVAFKSPDVPAALQALTTAFVFERELLDQCRARGMNRVVQCIDAGSVVVDDSPIGKVDYLIFQRADSDLRGYLSTAGKVEIAWKLRSLHHISAGLWQLHSAEIAHQDTKPSNVLVFGKDGSKISDLGCASLRKTPGPRDNLAFAGDRAYAPPEQLYGYLDPEWSRRRLGCDAYHLGSMIFFIFTGVSATSLIFKVMQPQHLPGAWSGTYREVLPYVREGFGRAVTEFGEHIPNGWLRSELKQLVEYLCEPDLDLRGHPLNRQGFAQRLSLERFVSRLDLLASRSEIQMRR